jgi:tetratricopeptide (TPR) repeat protein
MNDKVEGLIHDAYESMKNGDEESALSYLKEALRIDFEHQEVLYALKCLAWWLEKIKRLDDFHDPYEQGGYILSQWKPYYEFLERIGDAFVKGDDFEKGNAYEIGTDFDSCQYALRRFVFSRALYYFRALLKDGTSQHDSLLLLQIGRCCKGAGDWEEARKYLEQAGRFRRDDSAILSELADVNALLGEERAAKVLFREAFYLDPQAIDLSAMESKLIAGLRDKVRDLGYSGNELAEWIPVWGCVWGIFSIKREMKPVEVGRLKQSILSLENENGSKSGGNPNVKPRLLNRYFWLIDHCEYSRDTSGLMNDTLRKIQIIDSVVYGEYRT